MHQYIDLFRVPESTFALTVYGNKLSCRKVIPSKNVKVLIFFAMEMWNVNMWILNFKYFCLVKFSNVQVRGMITDFGDDMHCQFLEILRCLLDSCSLSGAQVYFHFLISLFFALLSRSDHRIGSWIDFLRFYNFFVNLNYCYYWYAIIFKFIFKSYLNVKYKNYFFF